MAYPGYYLADSSPIEIVTFPKAESASASSMPRGKFGPIAREHTDLSFETEEGVLWTYPQVRRRIWRLTFRITEYELEIFETLHQAVDGQRIAFYFMPDVDEESPIVSYLVRKEKDFQPQQTGTPHWDGTDIVPMYDYTLELREESEAAQILA